MILLIDNYDSFTYNLYQQIIALNVECTVIRNDQISVTEIAAMDITGIVLSPGPGRPEQAGVCEAVIKAFAGKLPILGICLGHQAIAQAFGGKVSKVEKIYHGKVSQISHTNQGLFVNLPERFAVGRYHSLHVAKVDVPNCFDIDAVTDEGVNMAIRHQHYPLYGLQFHPESILTPVGDQLMQRFVAQAEAKHV